MNKTLVMILSLFVISCSNNKQKVEKTKDCDSNFYSFFDNAICVETFQNERSRIENWIFEDLHPEKEYYFEISNTNNETTNEAGEDLINEKYLTKISIPDSIVTNYFFQKIDCKWYLTKKSKLKLNDYHNKEFIEFLDKFSNDSTFRIQHIKLPLKHGYLNYDDYSSQEKYLTIEEISKYNFLSNGCIYFLNDGKSFKRNLMFSIKGFGNGINAYYEFEYNNEDWLLTEDNDYST